MKEPIIGDYVLATKYRDGDPKDQWAVGFLAAIETSSKGTRYFVSNAEGVSFRSNGFRRVKSIKGKRGAWLLKNADSIESSSRSLWGWVRYPINK